VESRGNQIDPGLKGFLHNQQLPQPFPGKKMDFVILVLRGEIYSEVSQVPQEYHVKAMSGVLPQPTTESVLLNRTTLVLTWCMLVKWTQTPLQLCFVSI
jgi:hypothetical protein